MANNMYIDFGVTPYALADVCEALFKNGVTNAFLTKEDGDIHVRWEYKIDRGCRSVADKCDRGCKNVDDKCDNSILVDALDKWADKQLENMKKYNKQKL